MPSTRQLVQYCCCIQLPAAPDIFKLKQGLHLHALQQVSWDCNRYLHWKPGRHTLCLPQHSHTWNNRFLLLPSQMLTTPSPPPVAKVPKPGWYATAFTGNTTSTPFSLRRWHCSKQPGSRKTQHCSGSVSCCAMLSSCSPTLNAILTHLCVV